MHELTHAARVADEFVDAAATRLALVLQSKEKILLRRVVLRLFADDIVVFQPQKVEVVYIPANPVELCAWVNINNSLFLLGAIKIREMANREHIGLGRQKELQMILALIFHAMRV